MPDLCFIVKSYFHPRKELRVDKIFVHENYSVYDSKANDIALLLLGE